MPRSLAGALGRMAQAICILVAMAVSGIGDALASPESTGPTTNVSRSASGIDNSSIQNAPQRPEKPLWKDLSPAQQQALAPLSGEWDALEAGQKKKWLKIGNKYASLKPDQQVRLQDRMRDWVKLTPGERRVARESYSHTKKLDPDQKAAEWQQYQQLSEDQKKKLLDDAKTKKRITNLPPASQTKGKLTSPPKATPGSKPLVGPSPDNQSAKPESQQPSVK
jgi:hypothetical protein